MTAFSFFQLIFKLIKERNLFCIYIKVDEQGAYTLCILHTKSTHGLSHW